MTLQALLDTHALYWLVATPERLPTGVRALVTDASNGIGVSAASAWEIATKVRLGKWPGAAELAERFEDVTRRARLTEVPMTAADALRAGALDWGHRDPFDRMLAAQASLRRIPLLTCDPAFATYSAVEVRWE